MTNISSLAIKITICLARKARILLLLVEKITILIGYLDFPYIFWSESAKILPKQTRSHEYFIKLEKNKEQFYKLIFSLELIKFKNVKTHI